MAKKTSVAYQVDLNIELFPELKKVEQTRKKLEQQLSELDKWKAEKKIPVDIQLDLEGFEQELRKFTKAAKDAYAKEMRKFGVSARKDTNIAKEIKKALQADASFFDEQGKLIGEKFRKLLAKLDKDFATGGMSPGKRGKSYLKGYMLEAGKDFDHVMKFLDTSSKKLDAHINAFKAKRNEALESLPNITAFTREIAPDLKRKQATSVREMEGTRRAFESAVPKKEGGAYTAYKEFYLEEKGRGTPSTQLKYVTAYRSEIEKLITQVRVLEQLGEQGVSLGFTKQESAAALKALREEYRLLSGQVKDLTQSEKEAFSVEKARAVAAQKTFETYLAGKSRLKDARTFKSGKDVLPELLPELQSQAKKTAEAVLAMKAIKLDPETIRPYIEEWLRLRKEIASTKESLVKSDFDKAKTALVTAEKRAGDEAARVKEFSPTADARERINLYIGQRKAVENYITAIQNMLKMEGLTASETTKLNEKLKQQRKVLSDVEHQISGLDNLFLQLGRSFQLFLRYAVAYQVLYTIQSGFTGLAKTIVDLQHALVGIKAITNATTDSMVAIEESIKSVAETTSFTTDEIAKGGQTLAQAGVAIEDFGKVLRATANLASATGSSFDTTANVISSFMNVYRDMDVETIADGLRNAVNISKLTMEDLTSIANYLLQTTESFNISFETTLAAASTLRNAGFKASTIATGSRQAILELLSPDAKTLKALQARYAKIGIEMSQETIKAMFVGFRNASDPFIAVLNELEKLGMGSVADDELSRVFDIRAESAIRGLINNRNELLKNKTAIQETGTAAEGAKTQLESLVNQFQNLSEAVTTLVYDQSKGFVTWLRDSIEGLTQLVKKIQEYQTALKQKTGETGVGAGLAVGATSTVLLATLGKFSLGWSALLGVLFGGFETFAKYLSTANGALGTFAKVVADTAETIATAVGIALAGAAIGKAGGAVAGKVGEIGSKTWGGIKKAKGAVTGKGAAVEPKSMSEALSSGKAVEAAAAVGGIASIAEWVIAAFSFVKGLALKLTPAGKIAWAIGSAVTLYLWFKEFFGKSEKDLQKIKQESQNEAAAKDAQKIIEQKAKQDQLESADKATAEVIKQQQEKLLAAQATLDKYVAKGATAEALTEMSKGIEGSLAVGTKNLEDFANLVSKGMPTPVDQYELSGDLQKINEAIQSIDGFAKQRVQEYIKALDILQTQPEDATAQAQVKAYESLTLEQRSLLEGQISTFDEAKKAMEALGNPAALADTLKDKNVSMADIVEAQVSTYKNVIDSLVSGGEGADFTKNKQLITSKITDAVTKGQMDLVNALLAPFVDGKVFSPEQIASWKDTAQKNLRANLSAEFDKSIEDLTKNVKAEGSGLVSLRDYGGAKKEAISTDKMEADLNKAKAELLAINRAGSAAVSFGATEEELADINKRRLAKSTEVARMEDALALLKKADVDSAVKMDELKRSFYADQVEVQALEERLKMVHGAKLKDAELEAQITKQIYEIKKVQLEKEKEVLAQNLSKILSNKGIKTEGMTIEEILNEFKRPEINALLQSDSELADNYKLLAEKVGEEALLREKYYTDLDNIARTELEKKKKLLEREAQQADKKKDTIENQLQSVQNRLTDATEKLANAREKAAEDEAYFNNLLQEVDGKKLSKRDIQKKLNVAAETGSVELAKQAASEAKSSLSKSDAERVIMQARSVAGNINENAIADRQYEINMLSTQYQGLAAELKAATEKQEQLKNSLDSLNASIEMLGSGGVARAAAEKGVAPVEAAPTEQEPTQGATQFYKNEQGIYVKKYATGGLVTGPGSSTEDRIPILASAGEFVQPANAVSLYGSDFMDKLRNLQVDPNIIKVAAKPLGGTTAEKQRQMQPVMFNIGDAMINAQAPTDAVKQFQAALRLQAVKNGRRV